MSPPPGSGRIVLASRSPRRAELLTAAGIAFDIHAEEIDERPRNGELPASYVERLAIEKARAVFTRYHPDRIVLGADTIVVVDGRMLGKPVNGADAAEMLRAIRGRSHEVLTGVAVLGPAGLTAAVDRARVWFTAMTDEDISDYVKSGEPLDKAGAYAIQGVASRFIPRIEGSYTCVVGLPVALVSSILRGERPFRLSPEL